MNCQGGGVIFQFHAIFPRSHFQRTRITGFAEVVDFEPFDCFLRMGIDMDRNKDVGLFLIGKLDPFFQIEKGIFVSGEEHCRAKSRLNQVFKVLPNL